jgi:glycosyltransferase involved in cell wall biosynthesis
VKVAVIIPALDEEESIAAVIRELDGELRSLGHRPRVLVGDNGSRDRTAEVATDAGAIVASAPVRGYGTACLAAMRELEDEEVVIFADGDGADDPHDLAMLLEPIVHGEADLVIGSRALGERLGWVEKGALTPPQRFGNRLSTNLLRVLFGVHFTDLGPFRAITREALNTLGMDDPNFGWTVQMQARAARDGLRCVEVPVRYRRRRAGKSKVAGNLKGSVLAGTIILRSIFKELRG